MVGVITAVGGEVECHRQTLLPSREVAPVKGIGIGGGGKAGVLADGPGLIDVHGRVGPAEEGRLTGKALQRIARGHRRVPIGTDEEWLHHDVLRGMPVQLLRRVAVGRSRGRDEFSGCGLGRRRGGAFAGQWNVSEAGYAPVDGGAGSDHLRHASNPSSNTESAFTASMLAFR